MAKKKIEAPAPTAVADGKEPPKKYASDAYTGLLAISFLTMAGACVLLYLEYQQYEGKTPPPTPKIDVPGVQKSGPASKGGKPDPVPVVPEPEKKDDPEMKKEDPKVPEPEPKKEPVSIAPKALPTMPAEPVSVPAVVVPVKYEPANEADAPPLPVKRFVVPGG